MAINKVMRAALRALSYPSDIDLKKSYHVERAYMYLKHFPISKPFFTMWDHKVAYEDHEIPVRVFCPKGKKETDGLPLILYFHGGGWVVGNIDSYTNVCAYLSQKTGRLVVSVDYRLAPEHPFPAAVEDCYHVSREVFERLDLFHITSDQITLMGDSAGGNIAAAVSLMARDRGAFLPKKQILIYPATFNDHSKNSPFPSVAANGTNYLLTAKRIQEYMDFYAPNPKDKNNPYFAPLLAKDVSRQPDTLLITAEYDPLRDEGEAYGRKLMEAGNYVEIYRMRDALHGFFSLPPQFQHVRQAYDRINSFLERP